MRTYDTDILNYSYYSENDHVVVIEHKMRTYDEDILNYSFLSGYDHVVVSWT